MTLPPRRITGFVKNPSEHLRACFDIAPHRSISFYQTLQAQYSQSDDDDAELNFI